MIMELIASLLLSVIAVSGFRFDLTGEGFVSAGRGTIICIPVLILFAAVLFHSFRAGSRRMRIYAFLYAVVTAGFYAVGESFDRMGTLLWLKRNGGQALILFSVFFYHAVLNYCAAFLVFRLAEKYGKHPDHQAGNSRSSKRVLIYWGILFLCFLPWFLYLYPGHLTQDSEGMLRQVFGREPLSDHHSAFLTLCIHRIMYPVRNISGSFMTGLAVFLFLQMLFSAFVFALCLESISHTVSHRIIWGLFFLWFAFYPVYPIYSVTLWKDIPFSVCFLIMLLCIRKVIRSPYAFFRSAGSCLALFFSMLMLLILRHNGIAVVLVLSVCLVLQYKGFRKKIVLLCGSALILAGIWNMVLLPALHVEKVEAGLGLSVLQQQIARTLSRHHESLPQEEREALEAFFDIPAIWERYDPVLSDPVKKHFVEEKFAEDPKQFFSLWAKLGLRYPLDYIEAFLHNSFGYWFPDAGKHLHFAGSYVVTIEDIHPSPLIRSGLLDRIWNWYDNEEYYRTPVISLLFTPGACF